MKRKLLVLAALLSLCVLLAAVLAMVPVLIIAGIRHIILDIFDLITR